VNELLLCCCIGTHYYNHPVLFGCQISKKNVFAIKDQFCTLHEQARGSEGFDELV